MMIERRTSYVGICLNLGGAPAPFRDYFVEPVFLVRPWCIVICQRHEENLHDALRWTALAQTIPVYHPPPAEGEDLLVVTVHSWTWPVLFLRFPPLARISSSPITNPINGRPLFNTPLVCCCPLQPVSLASPVLSWLVMFINHRIGNLGSIWAQIMTPRLDMLNS
jgi:hypothetical protein